MRLKIYKSLLFTALIVLASCKKDVQEPSNKLSGEELRSANTMALAAPDGHLPLTVITIAGKYNIEGYADGVADQSRLLGVSGIDLADDGALYVADTYNHRIRKITMPNIVSTIKIPKSSSEESLFQPSIVRVQKDGTINVLAAPYEYQNLHSKFWIVKQGSSTSLTPIRHRADYTYYELEKDPYNNYLFIGGIKNTFTNGNDYQQAIIEKFLPDAEGSYGKDAIYLPQPAFSTIPDVTSLFCGYNAVKYIIIHSEKIYKLTPSGVYQELYRNHRFYQISDIVATKDSQTLYIAEQGAIKAITDGKITYLVGPHKELKGRDGVGAKADIYAFKLALSKDEGTLYFSDGHTTVRKLLLR